MELHEICRGEKQIVVLLDENMRIIKPVYDYREVSVNAIGEFKEYLMSGTYDNNVTYYNDIGKRTGKTVNRILSTV